MLQSIFYLTFGFVVSYTINCLNT